MGITVVSTYTLFKQINISIFSFMFICDYSKYLNGENLISWATTRQNVSSGVSVQARHNQPAQPQKLARVLKFRSRDIILSKQRTTKALIRLRGCAGWSAPLLFAYDIRHIFSWPGSFLGYQLSLHIKQHPVTAYISWWYDTVKMTRLALFLQDWKSL